MMDPSTAGGGKKGPEATDGTRMGGSMGTVFDLDRAPNKSKVFPHTGATMNEPACSRISRHPCQRSSPQIPRRVLSPGRFIVGAKYKILLNFL